MKEKILHNLTAECPWRDTLYWYDRIDSTNTRAKELAKAGAPHGSVLVAKTQTGGRGRMGRSFLSPTGEKEEGVAHKPAEYYTFDKQAYRRAVKAKLRMNWV